MNTQTKQSKNHLANEQKIKDWMLELWASFNKSDADRQLVLDIFAQAEEKFVNKPRIVEYFENIKQAFLKSEVEND
jgi:hypothetical protein